MEKPFLKKIDGAAVGLAKIALIPYEFAHIVSFSSMRLMFGDADFFKTLHQDDLEWTVRREAEALDLKPSKFSLDLTEQGRKTCSITKNDDGTFTINLPSREFYTRHCIRHELYHAHRHNCKEELSLLKFLRYIFVDENQAELYANFGIKV